MLGEIEFDLLDHAIFWESGCKIFIENGVSFSIHVKMNPDMKGKMELLKNSLFFLKKILQ